MGNNHACPVVQSGAADANDLLQGQRGLFLASEVITRQMALPQTFGIDGPSESSHLRPRSTARIRQLLIGQLWGPGSAPRSDSQQAPRLLLQMGGGGG